MKLVYGIIKKYLKLFMSIVLVSSLGCAIMTGLSSGHLSLVDTLNSYVVDGQYPEAIITSEVVNRKIINKINELKEVEKVEARLSGDTFVISPGGRLLSCSLFSYRDDDRQKFYFWDQIEPRNDDHVYIDYIFADGNDIKAGDHIRIKIDDEYRTYQVAGIISMPQTLAVETHGNKWNTNSDFGYIFASEKLLVKETEKRKSEEKVTIDNKHKVFLQNQSKANEYISNAESELKAAELELANAKKLYSDYSDNYKQVDKELISKRDLLNSYLSDIKEQRNYLTKTLQDISTMVTQAETSLEELEKASVYLEEIARTKKEIEAVNKQLSDAYAILAVLGRMDNYNLTDVFTAVNAFNDLLRVCVEHGFYYDVSEQVEHLTAAVLDFINGRKDDLVYLTSAETQNLIQRIVDREEGIQEKPEYIVLKNLLLQYNRDTSDDNIVESYLRVTDSLSIFVSYVDSYGLEELIPFLNSFGSSTSLGELLTRISKIEEILPILSMYSGIEIETTHDLYNAFEIARTKINELIIDLAKQKEQIIAELAKQGIKIEEIPSLIIELQDLIKSAPAVIDQIYSALSQIDSGVAQIDEYLKMINKVLSSLDQINDTYKKELNEAQIKYEAGKNSLDLARAEYLKQFADVQKEIEKAYARLDESEGYEDLANQFMVYFKDGVDQKFALAKIKKIITEEGEVKDSYVYVDSPVKGRIDANIAPLETMSYFVPLVFFAIVLLVVFMFMSLIIRQYRREIGILRALGFSRLKVTGIFCSINLCSSLIASVLGLLMGKIASVIIGNIYASFFPLPVFDYELDWKMFIFSALMTILVSQIATVLSALPIASIEPSEAMSRDLADNKEMPEFLMKLVGRSSPINKFSVLSLLRNPLKFVFSVLCIASTIVLIFVSLSIFASTDYLLNSYYDKQISYDVEMFFLNEPDQDYIRDLEALDYVENVEKVSYYYADMKANDKNKAGLIKTIDKDSKLIAMYDNKGNRLNLTNQGMIIDKTVADELDVQKGDTISIDGQTYPISNVTLQTLNFYNYLSSDEKRLGDPDLYTLICNVDEEREEELLRHLVENDDYLYSVFTDVSYASLERALRIYDDVVKMIIGFAMIIGLIIVLNTALTNILEKKRELSVLRTLGFQHADISRSWFAQSLLFFVSSCCIGIPSGIKITKICLDKLSTNGRLYVFVSGFKEYLLSMMLVLAYICLAHFLTMNSFRKWNYIENVKDKE